VNNNGLIVFETPSDATSVTFGGSHNKNPYSVRRTFYEVIYIYLMAPPSAYEDFAEMGRVL